MANYPLRAVARTVVLDTTGAILLVRYEDSRPGGLVSYWVPPGGALEQDETHRAAAARELREETGLGCKIGRELFERTLDVDFGAGPVHQVEKYFLVRVGAVAPRVANSSSEAIREHRWWPLVELERTQEVVYPEGIAAVLRNIVGEGRLRT